MYEKLGRRYSKHSEHGEYVLVKSRDRLNNLKPQLLKDGKFVYTKGGRRNEHKEAEVKEA